MGNNEYRFAFFGTPHFSVRVLDALESHGFSPAVIITAPDRPSGRGQGIKPSAVKEWALARSIDVLTPEKLTDESSIMDLLNSEWDFFIVAAYGKLIRNNLLTLPKRGVLNVHPSLLPHFRGPSPVLSAILADEKVTGVSIMLIDEEMDHGPVLAQAKVDVEDWPPRGSVLEDLLATEGGNLLSEVIPLYMKKELIPVDQEHAQASHSRKFTDADARIDLSNDAYQNLLKIRAFDRNPRAYYMTADDKRVIITDANIKDGNLELLSVLPEGKKEMLYSEYSKAQST